jgi:putative tryptophan/tyrosine transport system substrate-binding protein
MQNVAPQHGWGKTLVEGQPVRRRDLIMLVGGAVAGWPLGARAQQGRQRKIGFLCLGTPDPKPFLDALRSGLHELGYVEGKDFQLEVRRAQTK